VEFCADFKNVQRSQVWQNGKNFYKKTWKILQKIVFLKKSFGNFLMQEFYTFLKSAQNSASFDTNFKEFFSFNSYKGWCCFFKVKSSNKIETVQYCKKRLFIN
jgi:hypothetical protein